ncbi:MAG TPA: hypothetical protein VGK73_32370 [Polyangiaceae bacterium]
MALTVENINLVRQRCFANLKGRHVAEQIKALFDHLNHAGNPDLQFVSLSGSTSDQIVADVPCKVYAIYLRKPAASTTNAWAKGSDSATTAAGTGDVQLFLVGTSGGGKEHMLSFPTGLPMTAGLTFATHTTLTGTTDSNAADQPTGFAIVGAA